MRCKMRIANVSWIHVYFVILHCTCNKVIFSYHIFKHCIMKLKVVKHFTCIQEKFVHQRTAILLCHILILYIQPESINHSIHSILWCTNLKFWLFWGSWSYLTIHVQPYTTLQKWLKIFKQDLLLTLHKIMIFRQEKNGKTHLNSRCILLKQVHLS